MSDTQPSLFKVSNKTDLATLSSRDAKELLSYWQSLCTDTDMPVWREIALTEIPGVVPNLLVVEVLPPNNDFNIILMGSAVVIEVGQDNTGDLVHALPRGNEIVDRFKMLLETKGGYFLKDTPVYWASKDYKKHCALILPVADAKGAISHIIGWLGDFS